MCEMFDTPTSRSVRVACTGYIKAKYLKFQGENGKIGNGGQIEGYNMGETFQRSIGVPQNTHQINNQVVLV